MQDQSVFQFSENVMYTIIMDGGIQLDSTVTHCFQDGIILGDGTHVPQNKILFFRSAGNATTE